MWELSLGPRPQGGRGQPPKACTAHLPSDQHTGALLGPVQDAGLVSLGPPCHLLCPQPLDGEAIWLSGPSSNSVCATCKLLDPGQVASALLPHLNLGRRHAIEWRPTSVSSLEFSYSGVLRSSSSVSRAFNSVCSHCSLAQGWGLRVGNGAQMGPGPGGGDTAEPG